MCRTVVHDVLIFVVIIRDDESELARTLHTSAGDRPVACSRPSQLQISFSAISIPRSLPGSL